MMLSGEMFSRLQPDEDAVDGYRREAYLRAPVQMYCAGGEPSMVGCRLARAGARLFRDTLDPLYLCAHYLSLGVCVFVYGNGGWVGGWVALAGMMGGWVTTWVGVGMDGVLRCW